MIRIDKILYPTDFSSYSNQAYFHAIALAEHHGASLSIAFVWAPSSDGGDKDTWRDLLEDIRPANPDIPYTHVFMEGDPAAEMVRYAQDAGVDLIVMGTH